MVKFPRLQFTGFNQNYYLMNMMSQTTYDGFMARFLVATPSEVYIPLSQKMNADTANTVDMKAIFQNIHDCFKHGHQFQLTTEALEVFEDFHDNFVLKKREYDKYEDSLTMILSKAVGNLLRVAAIQCAMRFACSIQSEDVDMEDAKITGLDMKRAESVIKYSVKCQSVLNDGRKRCAKGKKRPAAMPDVECIDKEFIELYKGKIKKIYNNSINGKIPLSSITKNHWYPCIGKSTGADAFIFMEAIVKHGLGQLFEENGMKCFQFTEKENASADQISFFNKIGVKL